MRHRAGTHLWVVLLVGILGVGAACTKAPDDSQLTGQIQSKLNEDSGLQGKSITVQTSGGTVTLSGTVDNDAQRTAAARYASGIPGIKQVVNNLQTTPTAATVPAEPAPDQAAQTPAPEPARQQPNQNQVQRTGGPSAALRSRKWRLRQRLRPEKPWLRNNRHPLPSLRQLRRLRQPHRHRRRSRFLRAPRWPFGWWMRSTQKRRSLGKPSGQLWTRPYRARVTWRFLPDMTCKGTWWR